MIRAVNFRSPAAAGLARGVVLLLLLLGFAPGAARSAFAGGAAQRDPAKVVGPERCAECHKSEAAAWKATHHSTTFLRMHREADAKAIVSKLGGKRIKVNPHCLTCHYTRGLKAGKTRARWGVTCESCHGAAADWVDVHNTFGAKGITKETETPVHRKERLAKSVGAGMIQPSDTYAAVANCFSCHTVPDEELVNVGGHKPRSDFELVSWSQGEIRHNYQYSPDQKNRPASAAHKRVLYVTGRALDLEYSLRAAAKATGPGPFIDAATRAVGKALEHLEAAQAVPEVAVIIQAAARVTVKAGAEAELTRAADAVSAATKKFVKKHDGKALAVIDKLLPPRSAYKGQAQP